MPELGEPELLVNQTQNHKGWDKTNEDNNTQLPPSRYRAKMLSKERNTTSLPIYYEHQHGNMVLLLLPLDSTFLEPRITREDREDF